MNQAGDAYTNENFIFSLEGISVGREALQKLRLSYDQNGRNSEYFSHRQVYWCDDAFGHCTFNECTEYQAQSVVGSLRDSTFSKTTFLEGGGIMMENSRFTAIFSSYALGAEQLYELLCSSEDLRFVPLKIGEELWGVWFKRIPFKGEVTA